MTLCDSAHLGAVHDAVLAARPYGYVKAWYTWACRPFTGP